MPGIYSSDVSFRLESFRSPSYYSKHAWILNIKGAFWFESSLCLSQNNNDALFQQLCLWREGAATSVWPPDPGKGKRDRPWLQPLRMHERPVVARSSFPCASGQVPQAVLISWHTNPHRRQRSARGQRREPGAVNQHCGCERPTFSFQSAEWVRELPGWFVAWLVLSISLEITAGGGPQPGSTHSSITSPPLRNQREKEAEREKQALSFLPHSSNMLTGNFAASRALYDNPGSSSALISATKVHLRFSLSTIFLNNAISAANYTFHIAHYSLPWWQTHSSPTHFTSGALHAGVSPGSRCSTASFSH